MLISKSYQEWFRVDPSHFVELNDSVDTKRLPDGIYFVVAKWSTASETSWRKLQLFLEGRQLAEDFRIFLVDTDSKLADDLFAFSGARRGGMGELLLRLNGEMAGHLELENLLDKTEVSGVSNESEGLD